MTNRNHSNHSQQLYHSLWVPAARLAVGLRPRGAISQQQRPDDGEDRGGGGGGGWWPDLRLRLGKIGPLVLIVAGVIFDRTVLSAPSTGSRLVETDLSAKRHAIHGGQVLSKMAIAPPNWRLAPRSVQGRVRSMKLKARQPVFSA